MTAAAGSSPPPARRADAGTVRLGGRDVAGLLLCGDMYGAPYDLLAGFLGVRGDRARGIVARWRRAGYAQTIFRICHKPLCALNSPRSWRSLAG